MKTFNKALTWKYVERVKLPFRVNASFNETLTLLENFSTWFTIGNDGGSRELNEADRWSLWMKLLPLLLASFLLFSLPILWCNFRVLKEKTASYISLKITGYFTLIWVPSYHM